jgi:hypothetical protein
MSHERALPTPPESRRLNDIPQCSKTLPVMGCRARTKESFVLLNLLSQTGPFRTSPRGRTFHVNRSKFHGEDRLILICLWVEKPW